MSKIRINELARELEVKPNRILELLPGLGVSEKKTHSSSIDEDVALHVRRLLGFDAPAEGSYRALPHSDADELVSTDHEDALDAAAHDESPERESEPEPERHVPIAPVAETKPEPPVPAPVQAATPATEEKASEPQAPAQPAAPPRRFPLRPPLMGHPAAPAAPPPPTIVPAPPQPAAPPTPPPAPPAPAAAPPTAMVTPSAPPQPAAPQAPAAIHLPGPASHGAPGLPAAPQQPGAPRPGTPLRPAAPQPQAQRMGPGAPPARNVPIAPRPGMGTPRPGQILSGPRQPLPPETQRPAVVPAAPRPGAPAPPPRPAIPTQRPAGPPPAMVTTGGSPSVPGQPQPPRPPQQPSRPALAGQPAARPVVPPRPDLVARLQQQTTKPTPGAPRPASPVPGQPIYRGPIRPGQPIARGPGMPTPGQPGSRGPRPRPMHPTSPMRMEAANPVPATTDQRRHQARPGGPRQAPRDREQEREGRLRMPSRREAAAPPPIDREITISEGITVKELSEKLGIRANLVIKKLVEKKVFATINQTLDVKLAEEISREFGASTNKVSYEEEATQELELHEEAADLETRPPVVTIMGHVDHGKTSLLDAIRHANVAAKEAGGITQHIGAYHIEKDGRKVVFIDTPGHEAFTRMRARGAKVTDIVVLVVAADDGVMPQTIEAIDHARAAQVPIIVAINKIDKADARSERIKQQLTDRGLMPEEWGGETVMVEVSARTKVGIDRLLEMILLVADIQELKANPNRPAIGSVLEAQLDRGRGPVATVLVRNGTLKVGDHFICGQVFGKVRAMFDDRGGGVREAAPSMPVEVLGLDSLPDVGDTFQVVTDTAKAKQIVIYREGKAREQNLARGARMTLDQLHAQLAEGEVKDLNLILKTDVGGTAEVLSDTLQKLSNDKVRINVLRAGVGAINESDVLLASASNAIIIGFNVRPERTAVATADQEKVDIRLHSIIYEVTDEIKRAMAGLLEPVYREVYKGRAEVRDVFRISKVGTVAGCMVQDGSLTRDSQVRLLRDNIVVYTGKIDSLKRFKNDASEVKSGFECGVGLTNYNDIKPGDIIEAFVSERVAVETV